MTQKKTLVLGASTNPTRYSYTAVHNLKANGHEVVPLGVKEGEVAGEEVLIGQPPLEDIDTITLYLNPARQKAYYDYIISLHPRRIIFNPGTENPELVQLAKEHGIESEIACTLVMLSVGTY